MPLDLDQIAGTEDRAIIVRGHTFNIPRHRPEVLDAIDALEKEYLEIKEPGYTDVLAFVEGRLRLLLDDGNGQIEKYDELRSRAENAIEYGDIIAMSRAALEMVTRLPTVPAGPSQAGPGRTGSPSTVESS
jgi:hypothetical protein